MTYKIGESQLEFLKKVCEAFGPSGFEREVLKMFRDYIKPYADNILVDNLGSLIGVRKGSSERPKILIAGHVDEVGFIVTSINEKGYITFTTLGGWFDQVLLGQRVVIKTRNGYVHGVIACKPPHLLKEEERGKVIKRDRMFIDVGATDKKEVEKLGVRIGDPIAPWSPFTKTALEKTVFGKAFDDRLGAFISAEVLRYLKENNVEHPNTLYSGMTVQEEVGLRGAATTSWVVDHDVAIVAEVDIAGDVPGITPSQAPSKLGKGPSILTFDASMIPNQRLKEFIIRIAEENKIPYQLSIVARGGTDAGRFHLYKSGRPSIVIGVPTRHIHSHVGVFHIDDLENAIRLLIEVVKNLNEEEVKNLTSLD